MGRVLAATLVLAALAAVAFVLTGPPGRTAHPYFDASPEGRVEIIAHGGGLDARPANTMEALATALEMGADVLEVDVQQTKDGVLVLLHDDTLDRTTDLSGLVAEKTWNEISRADAGYTVAGVDYSGRGIGVPRLDTALAAFPNARWILEIKPDTENAAIAMCKAIKAADPEHRTLVGSFHDNAIAVFRTACPGVATGASTGEAQRFIIAARLGLARFVRIQANALQIPERAGALNLVHPHVLAAAKARGLRVQVWTVNERRDMDRLIALGVDGIITDHVDTLGEAVAAGR